MTRCSGKSCASVFHRTIVDDPMNSSPSFGGGFVRSLCSKAVMSFSHFSKLCTDSPDKAKSDCATTNQQTSGNKIVGFICCSLCQKRGPVQEATCLQPQSCGERRKCYFDFHSS